MHQDLQRRYHQGDIAALEKLWQLHEAGLTAQAMRQCRGDVALVEDALQELYRKLSEKKVQEQYDPERPWKPWASAILKNIVFRHPGVERYFCLRKDALEELAKVGVPGVTLNRLRGLYKRPYKSIAEFQKGLRGLVSPEEYDDFADLITGAAQHGCGEVCLDAEGLSRLAKEGLPLATRARLRGLYERRYYSEEEFQNALMGVLSPGESDRFAVLITQHAERGRELESLDRAGRQELPDATESSPVRPLQLREFGDAFEECFEVLSPTHQDIFTLHVLHGWSFEQVAQHVRGEAKPNLVSGPYYRAVRDLKKCLESKGYSEIDL